MIPCQTSYHIYQWKAGAVIKMINLCHVETGNKERGTKVVTVFDVLTPVQLDQELLKLHKLLSKTWGCGPGLIETGWIMHTGGFFSPKFFSFSGHIWRAECSLGARMCVHMLWNLLILKTDVWCIHCWPLHLVTFGGKTCNVVREGLIIWEWR